MYSELLELRSLIGSTLGNEKFATQKAATDFVKSKLPKDKRVLNKDLTTAIVYCVYRAINDKDRPGFRNDFTQQNVDGVHLK